MGFRHQHSTFQDEARALGGGNHGEAMAIGGNPDAQLAAEMVMGQWDDA